MKYDQMLRQSIREADLSLAQICRRLQKKGTRLDKAILSKLQNGKCPPAKDEVNIALAEVLEMDPVPFRIAAVQEVVPSELIHLIKETHTR
ncbi:hypothetical protein J2Z48_001743 [Croceifilum oryzae]|uniref:Uncharacterized protein n=1 Tax=Croceifilum oryzae TaxID=1553429 RepID=A0AAJ1TMN3_9BACL|nr:XRE family transcriptional regulator [Croceifilum oryzae]MDQ0417570.1 hypothetical protein [Croceifilum oryzae]